MISVPRSPVPQIVFVSTLFYLLSWSDEQYLPVQWVLDLLPHLAPPTSEGDEDKTTKQGEAFQRAIRCGCGFECWPRPHQLQCAILVVDNGVIILLIGC